MSFVPFNRGSQGHTPFLWFVNLYAEYTLRLCRTALNFNVNVDNVFDANMAVGVWQFRNLYQLEVTEDQILSKDWELETSGYVPDPRYKMNSVFYPPMTVRLGIKFIF